MLISSVNSILSISYFLPFNCKEFILIYPFDILGSDVSWEWKGESRGNPFYWEIECIQLNVLKDRWSQFFLVSHHSLPSYYMMQLLDEARPATASSETS